MITPERCIAQHLAGAYLAVLSLAVENFMYDNTRAQGRAKGLYEAAEIMRGFNPALPVASLKYLRSLTGCSAGCPIDKNPSDPVQHHLRHALGCCSCQIPHGCHPHATPDTSDSERGE